ncbi:hypothetical protein BOX15_Mlig003431g1 [Macrostomum lignano]|uniref:Uncharacterized protein n=2 Tax=Macrostomum lignano TaxID=282301 RepID=A0A267DM03_9PLAT|nr:hypothetical protein BOX15_Mlig003431g3 [Macrostomum lignano]PAA63765.1 hypothetical protein BOX15_Mlig003431g1 [Macrostomum lignano]
MAALLNAKSWVRLLALLLAACHLCELCFVANCPPGGKKRSFPGKQLSACKPSCGSGKGVCLGRSLCCGNFGCIVGNAARKDCAGADEMRAFLGRLTCRRSLPRCTLERGGRCSAPGVCCDLDSCRAAKECNEFRWGRSTDGSA